MFQYTDFVLAYKSLVFPQTLLSLWNILALSQKGLYRTFKELLKYDLLLETFLHVPSEFYSGSQSALLPPLINCFMS